MVGRIRSPEIGDIGTDSGGRRRLIHSRAELRQHAIGPALKSVHAVVHAAVVVSGVRVLVVADKGRGICIPVPRIGEPEIIRPSRCILHGPVGESIVGTVGVVFRNIQRLPGVIEGKLVCPAASRLNLLVVGGYRVSQRAVICDPVGVDVGSGRGHEVGSIHHHIADVLHERRARDRPKSSGVIRRERRNLSRVASCGVSDIHVRDDIAGGRSLCTGRGAGVTGNSD